MKNKILVVDDEQSIVTLLQYNLDQAGYEVLLRWMVKRETDLLRPRPRYHCFRSHVAEVGWNGSMQTAPSKENNDSYINVNC